MRPSRAFLLRWRRGGIAVGLLALLVVSAGPASPEHDPASEVVVPLPPDVRPRIDAVVAPLFSAPAIQEPGDRLTVELDPERTGRVGTVQARLVPSFGHVRRPVDLVPDGGPQAGVRSELWPDRDVLAQGFLLPDDLLAGLYDLQVSWEGPAGTDGDRQRRALSVVDEHPDAPRVVVIADPSVGDPRAVQEGIEDAAADQDPAVLLDKVTATTGDIRDPRRWQALNRAIDEINLVRPDAVLVAGDLTFGLHPRGLPYEYEDAYRVFDRVEVPTFFTPGNHDLYAFDDYAPDGPYTVDGQELWTRFFGPLHYATDLTADLRLLSLNTFEWPERTPVPPGETGFLSGGQVSDQQLAWLEDELERTRRRSPRTEIVSVAHHDPSWIEGRHPWAGVNRLALRDLLAEYEVGAHFAGHTHEDRVARYHRGDIVQTNGRPHVDHPVGELSYLRRDDTIDDDWSQRRLGRILRQPHHGPLFVTTTTAASGLRDEEWGLGGYWGWRLADLDPHPGGGYDPAGFGYPATSDFLDAHAVRPENYNADHARFGLFSYPSEHLEATTVRGNDGEQPTAVVELASDLLVSIETTVRVTVAADADDEILVSGGRLIRQRRGDGVADLWIRAHVPEHSRTMVRAATE